MKAAVRLILPALFLCVTAAPAAAQGWKPEQQVEISVAAGPGGGADRTARLIQRLAQEKKLLPHPVVVVNKPGGGGALAMRYLEQHAGNAHFLQMYSANVLAGNVAGKVPLNHNDMTPLATFYTEYSLVAVRTESPVKSGKEMMERLRQDPGSLTLTVGIGLGNINHIGAAVPMRLAGVDVRKVKTVVFNTVAESVTAVLGGHIDMVAATPSIVMQHVQAGRMRVLGIAAPQRITGSFASVPTWREQGIDAVSSFWLGIYGAKGISPAQVAYWEEILAALAGTPEWKEQMEKFQLSPMFLKSAETKQFLARQYTQIHTVLTELGMAKQ